MTVNCYSYYAEYHGHRIEHLREIHSGLGSGGRVWFVGDSSLDNKYYVPKGGHAAPPGYSEILSPALSRADVCYWLQGLLAGEGSATASELNLHAINAAVEESTLASRGAHLLPQDEFVRDNLGAEDVLVCSVGGNDVALKPSLWTALAAAKAVYLNSDSIENQRPGSVWGMPHFRKLFKRDTENYLQKLVEKTKPRLVVVCMIYFPHEDPQVHSWAAQALRLLQYDTKPRRLQQFIKAVYKEATSHVSVDGVRVIPCALFDAMDGKDSDLYVARVEPSELGGQSIAQLLLSKIRLALFGLETPPEEEKEGAAV